MAKSYLQDALVEIEIKIYFIIYLVVPKSFLQDIFYEKENTFLITEL